MFPYKLILLSLSQWIKGNILSILLSMIVKRLYRDSIIIYDDKSNDDNNININIVIEVLYNILKIKKIIIKIKY